MAEAATPLGDAKSIVARLKERLGNDAVFESDEDRAYFSQDVYGERPPVLAAIRPKTVEDLAAAVAMATDAGVAVFPRGGGYSYTDAYLPTTSHGITVDTRGLDRVVEINATDMYATVETGCTWAALDAALEPHGVRAAFWGPLSGYIATVGGALSQGAASLGSSKHGMSADSVLSVDVVLADGRIISTGSAAQEGKAPFFRTYGPDLTGLFCNDAGALGIKARATLKLVPRAPIVHGLAFACGSFADLTHAMAAIARLSMATESFGFPAQAMAQQTASKGLLNDLATWIQVGRSAGHWLTGLKQMTSMALAGRNFTKGAPFSISCVVEAENRSHLIGQIEAIRHAVGGLGSDIPNTAPTVIRAAPFLPYDAVTASGMRMLPLHTILPFSKVEEFHAAIGALLDGAEGARMKDAKVTWSSMYTTLGTTGFLYEPVFFWPDEPSLFHRRHSKPEVLEKMKGHAANPAARALVDELKGKVMALMHKHGGVHLQVGKAYPYMADRTPAAAAALKTIKAHVDPNGLINPGALGLS